jgi:hypothetical protein
MTEEQLISAFQNVEENFNKAFTAGATVRS